MLAGIMGCMGFNLILLKKNARYRDMLDAGLHIYAL
jgi:hypothetical protein